MLAHSRDAHRVLGAARVGNEPRLGTRVRDEIARLLNARSTRAAVACSARRKNWIGRGFDRRGKTRRAELRTIRAEASGPKLARQAACGHELRSIPPDPDEVVTGRGTGRSFVVESCVRRRRGWSATRRTGRANGKEAVGRSAKPNSKMPASEGRGMRLPSEWREPVQCQLAAERPVDHRELAVLLIAR